MHIIYNCKRQMALVCINMQIIHVIAIIANHTNPLTAMYQLKPALLIYDLNCLVRILHIHVPSILG